MDSKQRHRLEQNELAKWIVAQYEDWIRPSSGWLGYAVIGVLVVVVIIMVTARVNAWNQKAAWKQYYAALQSPQAEEDFELVANSTSGIVGVHARLALAQRQLSEGCTQVFIDKKEAIVLLEKAIAAFQMVQKGTNDSLILRKAGFGLGQCWETLAAARIGDDLAKAVEEYTKVASQWADSFEGKQAKKQLASLQQPATKNLLALLATKTVEDSGVDDIRESLGFVNPFDISTNEVTIESDVKDTTTESEPEPTPDTSEE